MDTVSVIGGGAWGTALAQVAAQSGRRICLWARETDVVSSVNEDRRNSVYLPDVELSDRISATIDLSRAAQADLLLLVTPAQHLRAVTQAMAASVADGTVLAICAKGIEQGTHQLMSEVAAETLPGCIPSVLSGPTFAIEVARGLPTAVTLACADEAVGGRVAEAIGQPHFRPYLSDDVVGAQIGGALKNVIAIACGIVHGLQLGDNARAALMTRGLAELVRYGLARGGRQETLMGLSGLGDLALTCNSEQSRNMSLGIQLGRGRTMAEIMAARNTVAEGAHTVGAIADPANPLKADMPICRAVDTVVNQQANLADTIENILSRPFRGETE
jgi:glycerol-3-phosphate dehydrogenase (NAD(P)+)